MAIPDKLKSLTPKQAYKLLEEIAKKNNMSPSAWAESKGVRKSTISHWRCRPQKTILLSTLEKLGIKV